MITDFEFMIFFIMIKTIVNIRTQLNTDRFHFDCCEICIFVFMNYFMQHINGHTSWCQSCILFFKVLINLSATTDFILLCFEYISVSLSCNYDFNDLFKTHHPDLPISCLIYNQTHQNKFWDVLVLVTHFLFFSGTTHAYLLKYH